MGADINATGCYNSEGQVQISPYCAAIYYNKPKIAEFLLKQGPKHDIFRLAFLGNKTLVDQELKMNSDLINAEDPNDEIYYTPLIAFAVAGGHVDLLKFLLKKGAILTP